MVSIFLNYACNLVPDRSSEQGLGMVIISDRISNQEFGNLKCWKNFSALLLSSLKDTPFRLNVLTKMTTRSEHVHHVCETKSSSFILTIQQCVGWQFLFASMSIFKLRRNALAMHEEFEFLFSKEFKIVVCKRIWYYSISWRQSCTKKNKIF